MAFENQDLTKIPTNVGIGEIWETSPNAVKAYGNFQDGLKIGYFAQNIGGVISNVANATDKIVGVVKRNTTAYQETATYQKDIPYPRDTVDIVNLGGVSVAVVDGLTIAEGEAVYVVTTGADAGKATNVAADNLAVDAFFQHAVEGGRKIMIKNYLA